MRKTDWIGFLTILRKEYIRIVRIWSQTLLPPTINVSLYLLIFGGFIGNRIGLIGNITYAEFIVPGLIMMSVITNAYANVSTSFFSAKFQKNIEEILVSPLPESLIVLGYTFGGIIRGVLVATCVTMIVYIFIPVTVMHPFWALLLLFLTAAFFSLAGLFNALFAKKFDDISFIPTFVLTPMTYLGGIFYSIQNLPPFWKNVSEINPILHIVNAFRYAFWGASDTSPVVAFIFLIIGNILLFVLCTLYLKRGLGIRN